MTRRSATVAVVTDLWPSQSEPHSGSFVYSQAAHLGEWFRQLILVPILLGPRLHRRVWGTAVQGWQRDRWPLPLPHQVIGYPMLRVPKYGEAAARAIGARVALFRAREKPQLVHGHFLLHAGAAAVRLGRALGVPVVLTAHGSDVRFLDGGVQPWLRDEMLDACARAQRIVAVEDGLAAALVRHGVPEGKVEVIPMGVDAKLFGIVARSDARRRLGLDADGRIVLFVGRATQAKGVGILDDALRRLRGSGTPLAGYAAGPVELPLRELRSVGTLPAEELACWINAADVVCLPSYAEGMPVSVGEALACGTPVVATPVGGIPGLVREGENGLLVPVGDAEALAHALLAAVERPWAREEIRQSSSWLWWSAVAPRLARLLEDVLDESRSRGGADRS